MRDNVQSCPVPAERAFALAASPHPRQSHFADAGALLEAIALRAGLTILPRRLSVSSPAGIVTLVMRRRLLSGIAAVDPADLWPPGAVLPAPACDETTEAAAQAIARLFDGAGEIVLTTGFAEAGDPVDEAGQPLTPLLDALARAIPGGIAPPDRSALLDGFFEAQAGLPRVILGDTRRIELPKGTPAHIRTLFDKVAPAHVRTKPGDAPEVTLFEEGTKGGALTVKVSDETRLCLVHAAKPAQADLLISASRQVKRALDRADAPDTNRLLH